MQPTKTRKNHIKKTSIIGLTGGIGSGKTTAANFFAELGVTVIDADVIAREVVTPGSNTLKKIIAHFGSEIADSSGALQRSKLREIIFNDVNAREWLENLLHPLILQEIHRQAEKTHASYCIAVIPLLLEKNAHEGIDRILVIDAPEDLQIERAKQRDDLSETQVKNILATQLSRAQRLTKADDVILNDNDLKSLKQKIKALHIEYLKGKPHASQKP